MLEWIDLLLRAVDEKAHEKAISYLNEFVTPAAHKVTSRYKKQIEKKVSFAHRSTHTLYDTCMY